MITLKQLKNDYKGIYTEQVTDNRGLQFTLSLFETGLVITLKVCDPTGKNIYYNASGADSFKAAAQIFKNTLARIKDNDDRIHALLARRVHVDYMEVKNAVMQWAVDHQRTMTLGDAQIIAGKFPDRTTAIDYVYTVCCALTNDYSNSAFCQKNNFKFDFRLR